jgi:hypothetical protein
MFPITRGPGHGTPAALAAAPPASTSATTRSPGPAALTSTGGSADPREAP